MKMSYRRAWLLVQSINEAAGEPLVEALLGGPQSGARLTPLGRWAASAFRDLQSLFDEKVGPLTAHSYQPRRANDFSTYQNDPLVPYLSYRYIHLDTMSAQTAALGKRK